MKSTEPDTELLVTAVKRGYFMVPRQTSLLDIADAHGMSDVEASERLRSGIDAVLREHLDGVDDTVASEQD